MGEGGPMPPDMMAQGGQPPMGPDGQPIPPEIMMQIQDEMAAAGDGMPGDGLPIQ